VLVIQPTLSSPGLTGRSSIPEAVVSIETGRRTGGCPACAGHDTLDGVGRRTN
jgi:hypothetical protein